MTNVKLQLGLPHYSSIKNSKFITKTNKIMKKLILSAIVLSMAATSVMAEDAAEDANKRWTKSGNASLQFTQGYISKNWYKGGVSSFALLGTADYTFNYKYEKFAWDNAIEAKLGFVNASSQYRTFITNNDILKWTTKLGYQATEHWYYTVQGIAQTQFCTGWQEVDNDVVEISKFLNPGTINLSVGMDWKKETEKIKASLYMSPFGYNLKFVSDPRRAYDSDGVWHKGRIDGTQFGLHPGDFNLYDFGVGAKATLEYKVCKYLTWTSQATYYSPLWDCGKYKNNVYTEVDWENTFDMPLNKYFSTKLYTHLRFDDAVAPEKKGEGWGYFQFTELLSFGLSYKW